MGRKSDVVFGVCGSVVSDRTLDGEPRVVSVGVRVGG